MIFGHQKIRQILQGQIKNDKLSHAYLFFGPEGIGKKGIAEEFGRALLCLNSRSGWFCSRCDSCYSIAVGAHPDFQFIGPESEETEKFSRTKEIGISSIRKVIEWNRLKPVLGVRKVIIINDAQWMSTETQNAFLKSLEEPADSTIFILVAPSVNDLLKTVVSRCRQIKFLPLSFADFSRALEDFKIEPARLSELYFIFSGRIGPAMSFATTEGQKEFSRARAELLGIFRMDLGARYRFSEKLTKNEKKLLETINLWRILLRDLIFIKEGITDVLINGTLESVLIKEARSHKPDKLLRIFKLLGRLSFSLKETNLNPRLGLDWVMTGL